MSVQNTSDFYTLADALRQEQEKARKNNNDEDNTFSDTATNVGRVLRAGKGAGTAGISTGLSIRQKINEGRLDGGTFITLMLLSLFKDLADIASMGAIGPILNVFVSISLFIIFFMKRSRIKRFLIRRMIWPILINFIPFITVFPFYTVSTLLLKQKNDKMIKQYEAELREVERDDM